jgi:hypothetical protein
MLGASVSDTGHPIRRRRSDIADDAQIRQMPRYMVDNIQVRGLYNENTVRRRSAEWRASEALH